MRSSSDVRKLVLGIAGILVLALVFTRWSQASSPATVALSFLIVVLLVAATARLWVAVTTSLAAMLAFNYFFLPPIGTFTIADPQNWIALFAFLITAVTASELSERAGREARNANERRRELERLYGFSQQLLSSDNA